MAEKSPSVHPIRQRKVLTPARPQVGLEDQNPGELIGRGLAVDFDFEQVEVVDLSELHFSLRCVVDVNSPDRRRNMDCEAENP